MKKYLTVFLAACVFAGLCLLGIAPTAAEPANLYEPPANLSQLSQAEQLAYFNLVVNRVRTEKPGFKQRVSMKLDDMRFSGVVGGVSSIIDTVIDQLVPGDWEETAVGAGEPNTGLFFSENANASDLRPEDITSITCRREGNNWVIELGVVNEIDPGLELASAHNRVMPIATREQVVEEIVEVNSVINANPKDAALRYYNGFARVAINSEGKAVSAGYGFQVHAQINNVRITFLRTDATVLETAEWQCAYFDWAAEESFPPVHFSFGNDGPPSSMFQWWERMSGLLQWFLRWFCFGWLWMK